jgi:lantibiotic modifying enzyme
MTLSEAELDAIVSAAVEGDATSVRARLRLEMQRMLKALPDFEFQTKRTTPLAKLCAAGADYGWCELQRTSRPNLLSDLSGKAKASLRRDLRHRLERITRPSFELEWKSFGSAMNSIGILTAPPDSQAERMFLRDKPADRLFSLFKKFPVLARLWCQVISQWRKYVMEILSRFTLDRSDLSRAFFNRRPVARILDLRCSLSDSHNSGRTVARLKCEAGSIIYKPRSGAGEWDWFSLIESMNKRSFRPKLRAAPVLRRKGYCWMEYVESASCESQAAARRFYERIGGMIAAAHLLKLVDCHRDNFIASGEHPVLVDTDALWHVSALTKTQAISTVLYRTGFFPNADRRSLQSRSSALGHGTTGNHLPRLGGKALKAAHYQAEIIRGFTRAWRCILGTGHRRRAFERRLRRIRSGERRWIYWATEKYAAIRDASLQPAVLRSGREREQLIRRQCTRDIVTPAVIHAEVRALKQLDIPYFLRQTDEWLPQDKLPLPGELIEAIQRALKLCA